ncbi:MAG: (Fe-S)-binding protein [Syntrophomonadaceae bacterium]|nr:(Fe-S)-binding protein [Syntrophomonadaceae bacterium]MDD3889346.1 (Fe-S)-binding protein [Syntrophomonadaceae bacterium]
MTATNDLFTTLEQETLICGRCGYCRSVCPVYEVIGWESSTPRGKISLAREIFAHGKRNKLGEDFVKRLDQCTLCGACANVCSTCIDTRSLWLELRKRVADEGLAPEAYVNLKNNLITNKNISTFSNSDRLEWAEDLDEEPEGLELEEEADVCYFVGCVSSFYPQAAQVPLAICEILMQAGINFTTMGGEEWCCGYPLVSAGFVKDAEPFIKHNVAKIKELNIHTLIASCATCYHFWKHACAEELKGYNLEILHTTEYLARLIKTGKIQFDELDEVVTYHDPCDLGRNGGIFAAPREVITSIPGVELVEMQHNRSNSLCCGGGGNLQSVDPALAGHISALRVDEIKETGATIVVSACQQCEQMLSAGIREAGLKVRVMDISQLLQEVLL